MLPPNHMQIQVLPVGRDQAAGARDALEAVVKRYLPGVILKRVASHAEVAEHLNDDSSTPYIYFEIPGDNTAKGRQVERYVYSQIGDDAPRIPMNLGRMLVCHLLDCDAKIDWRKCAEDRESEKKVATRFRERFKEYAPK